MVRMNVSCNDLKACPASSCDTNHAHPSSGTKSLSSKSGQLIWYGCMSLVIISRHVRPARMTRIMPIQALILSHYPPSPASSCDTNHAHPSSGTKSLSSKSGQLVWYGCMSLVIISRHVWQARMTRIMPIRALILSHYPPSPASSYGMNECLL